MTVLLVTLFTEVTIGFHDTTLGRSAKKTENGDWTSIKSPTHSDDYLGNAKLSFQSGLGAHHRSHSTTNPNGPVKTPLTIGRTPGATTTAEDVFRPANNAAHFELRLPEYLTKTNHTRNISATSLTTLKGLDSIAGNWGQAGPIKQPHSMADSPPSRSIFQDNEVHADSDDDSNPIFQKSSPMDRKDTEDFDYRTDNYTIEKSAFSNAGLHSAINAVSPRDRDITWIGTLGMPTDALSQPVKDHIGNKMQTDFDTHVVWVGDTLMSAHYENYCKTILWQILHSQIPDVPSSKAYQDNSWTHYKKVNKAFAEAIVENYKKDDVIWVNDYHLLLVPAMVRSKLPNAKIGLFLHVAFPPSEIFRVLPARTQLITGMLGANMIAFQTEEFKYQFLSTCNRLLNCEAIETGLILEQGRSVDVEVVPMGIDIDQMKAQRQHPTVKDCMKELSERFVGKHIIVSRDKLDTVHGINHKLRGYRTLLEEHPHWADKAVLVQIATSITTDRDLVEDIQHKIMTINRDFGNLSHQPVVFLNIDIDYPQYLALLAIADCMLITSITEGMNLTCHDFIVSQDKELSLKGHAPLVISESIGAAHVLKDSALLVNPWHPKGVADALDKALKMTRHEKQERWQKMYSTIQQNSARAWYETFLNKLDHAWESHSTKDPLSVARLKTKTLHQKFTASSSRLLILDFEGTLTVWDTPKETTVTVPLQVLDVLRSLIDDDRNTIYIMSQQPMEALEHMFRSVPGLGLIAENGAFIRKYLRQDWQLVTEIDTNVWRDGVMGMLENTKTAIPGSVIKELRSGIIFHYVDAEDQEDAIAKAGHLSSQINETCEQLKVSAVPFKQGLYIHPLKINKDLALQVVENEHFKKNTTKKPDFALVIGDSNDDECAFKWGNELGNMIDSDRIFTVIVGKRSTVAKASITPGTAAVVSALEKLAAADAYSSTA